MGFRSVMISEDFDVELPQWFQEKHQSNINFTLKEDRSNLGHYYTSFPIRTYKERKFYSAFKDEEIFKDLQKVILERKMIQLVVVLLHECGGISRVEISQTEIQGSEPLTWKSVDGVNHDYCYGCSDIKYINK